MTDTYVNETVLTPLFRYLLWHVEKDGGNLFEQARKEIEAFFQDGETNEFSDEEKAYFKRTIRLLELKSEGEGAMHSFWEKECGKISSLECKRCVTCKDCRIYFWKEMGEILFQKPNDRKHAEEYLPVRRIPRQIERTLEPSKKAAELYFSNHFRKKPKIKDGCIILKGMSSSTPSLMNGIYDTGRYSGGGLYLRHKGVGVAVDPGYHFLENLHHYGLSVLDIDVVVITHEHIDHNNDMRLLDDLHYAARRYEKDGKKKLKWYMDEVSYKIANVYRENGTGFDEKANDLHCVFSQEEEAPAVAREPESIALDEDGLFQMKCFETMHIEDMAEASGYKRHTFGCQFRLGDGTKSRFAVYTSDTRYFPELAGYMEMPDILIANISGVYEDDFMLVRPKQRHLGYYGCYYLLKDFWNRFGRLPGLVLLSEFWNGERDIRYDVASFLENQIRQECAGFAPRILPAEVGMTARLMDGFVRCSQCGTYTDDFVVRKPRGYEEKIKVICRECVY